VRLLVTNDDGIDSEGIQILARALADDGHEVLVVAPDRDWSGAGASLGMISSDEGLRTQRVEIPGAPGVEAHSLSGPPAMTVVAASLGAFGEPPQMVVSGINAGLNTGRSILHSGTVGAALAAQNFGFSGLAVSLAEADRWYWETAADLAVSVLGRLIDAPARSVLNLNVPGVPRAEVGGVRWARLAPLGALRSAVSAGPDGHLVFELHPTEYEPGADTDQGVVQAGFASLTTLVGVVEAWPAEEGLEPLGPQGYEDRILPGAPLHPLHRVPDASQSRTLHRPHLPES
jgi:5'-nucleotidase